MAKSNGSDEATKARSDEGTVAPSPKAQGPGPNKRFTIRGRQDRPLPSHAKIERTSDDLAYCDDPITADTLRQRGFDVIDNETGNPYDGRRHVKA